jgi:hypothetical protein
MNPNSPYSLIHSAANRAAGSLLSLADIAYKADCGQADLSELAEAYSDTAAFMNSLFSIPTGNCRIYPGENARPIDSIQRGEWADEFGEIAMPYAHPLISNIHADAEYWLDAFPDIDPKSGLAYIEINPGSCKRGESAKRHYWHPELSAPHFFYEFDFSEAPAAIASDIMIGLRLAGWVIEPAESPIAEFGMMPAPADFNDAEKLMLYDMRIEMAFPDAVETVLAERETRRIEAPAFKPRPGGFLFSDRLSRIA